MSADRKATIARFAEAAGDNDLLANLLLSSRACVKLVDLSGSLICMNPGGQQLMEIDDFDLVRGKQWSSIWPDGERETISRSVTEALAGNTSVFSAFCPTAKGTPRWWEVTVSPVRNNAGEIVAILSSSYDVSHFKSSEEQLSKDLDSTRTTIVSLARQLEIETSRLAEARYRISHAGKLQVLGKFVGNLVHDLNNVLATMHSAARLLRRRVNGAAELDIIGHLDRSVERGTGLVRRLLDFSRSDDAPVEIIEPALALSENAVLLRQLVGENLPLSIDAPQECWPILVEPQRFQSVLFNLVANARDACESVPNPSIRVTVFNCHQLERPLGLRAADYTVLCVRDNGAGMPPDVLARLGEPFFTTKPEGKGTGLGLASAFDLAEESHGRVLIDSEPGQGTTISIYLPRAAAIGENVSRPDAPIDPSLHGGACILIVEDEALVRAHLASTMRELGYTVLEAASEEQGVAILMQQIKIDLVISDLHLGEGSGAGLVGRVREASPTIPVIFITGSSGAGAPRDEVVFHKPISEELLARAVLERLGRMPGSRLVAQALQQTHRVRARIRKPDTRALFDLWNAAAVDTNRLPRISDIPAAAWNEDAYLVEVAASAPSTIFRVVRAGANLEARLGSTMAGVIATREDENVFGSLAHAYRRCMNGGAYFDFARIALDPATLMLFERLLLPLSEDGKRVTHLVGVATFETVSRERPRHD